MISNKCLKAYSDLILKALDVYSEETAITVAEIINTDEKCAEAERIIEQRLKEHEFIERINKL